MKEHMMSREVAKEPRDLSRLFFERVNAGDVGGVVELFEPDAVSRFPDGTLAVGHDQLRAAFEELIASGVEFSAVDDRPSLVNGDLAMTSRHLPIGDVPVEVARRQADGSWRWVLDWANVLAS
ncbi:YybH family protein [Nonomuraea glycinis]|uniref:YybH family protein n=1 Tax=Nonomuraea glycinis TaxID=2047744 RepID=UPI0033B17BE7